ncbi:hypothetical protein [Streptomyces sp. GC420]|uniref:hypothetical protein n=1 Tax=Streptomyces sp. GC420 TaxID=2697568 RepID=UPI001FB6A582|nr:hypothetical protein [Streptomyces sp. GC420]
MRETVAVAEAALRDLEPLESGRHAGDAAVSLRGALHLRCAIAHARGTQAADPWARIDAALEDADRLGPDWYDVDQQAVFGRCTVAVHPAQTGPRPPHTSSAAPGPFAAAVGRVFRSWRTAGSGGFRS